MWPVPWMWSCSCERFIWTVRRNCSNGLFSALSIFFPDLGAKYACVSKRVQEKPGFGYVGGHWKPDDWKDGSHGTTLNPFRSLLGAEDQLTLNCVDRDTKTIYHWQPFQFLSGKKWKCIHRNFAVAFCRANIPFALCRAQSTIQLSNLARSMLSILAVATLGLSVCDNNRRPNSCGQYFATKQSDLEARSCEWLRTRVKFDSLLVEKAVSSLWLDTARSQAVSGFQPITKLTCSCFVIEKIRRPSEFLLSPKVASVKY